MRNPPTSAEIHSLFANGNPDEVWPRAAEIIKSINPAYDFRLARIAFDDVVRLFRGEYPGFGPIMMPYHDLSHTLDVFMCAVRLMHGVHISGARLADNEMTMIMMAALMHDIGFAQLRGEESGTGAQYTRTHVARGVEFMRRYVVERSFPPDMAIPLEFMIQSTNYLRPFSDIVFPNERTRLLGQIVATADLVGQMSDRAYLEKLLLLYLEFKEAHLGDYKNARDLLSKSHKFYETTRQKLDGDFCGVYANLALHFKDRFGVEANYYMESIDKNIAYLAKVMSSGEEEYLAMLKRGGIVKRTLTMNVLE